ncbi:MAG: ABC transporter substrate-binding protein [Armatimonadetes bacterium]|nr:ABC transporter substrate-binding protein [Armatimonadota bacterium]
MSRRGALILLILGALCLICGCGQKRASHKNGVVHLEFWNGFSGPDGTTMERIVREFNKLHPDIQVRMQIIPWGTYYDKVTLGLAFGGSPDVFVVHADRLPEYADRSALYDMDELIRSDSISAADFMPRPWNAGNWKGVQYAIPLDCHPIGLYYNTKLFEKAGIVDDAGRAKPPTNLAEFVDAAQKLTIDSNGDGAPEQWGYVFTWFRTNYYTYLSQFGGDLFTADGRKPALNSPQAQDSLDLMRDFIYNRRFAPSPEGQDAWIGFLTGKVAMALEGIYMLSSMESQEDLHFAGAPCPVFGKKPGAWANSHMLVMPADSDPVKREAAWKFIKYLSDNSLKWAEGGQVPVRRDILESPEFKKLTVQHEFSKQLPYINYMPSSISLNQALPFFDAAVEAVLCNIKPASEALAEADRRIGEVMSRQ